jgi:hypothetical protein
MSGCPIDFIIQRHEHLIRIVDTLIQRARDDGYPEMERALLELKSCMNLELDLIKELT